MDYNDRYTVYSTEFYGIPKREYILLDTEIWLK